MKYSKPLNASRSLYIKSYNTIKSPQGLPSLYLKIDFIIILYIRKRLYIKLQ
jgi:hypothetical protein